MGQSKRNGVIKELETLVSDYKFIYVIAAINLQDFCGTVEKLVTQDRYANLNYNEFVFLIGLWLKCVQNDQQSVEHYDYKYAYNRARYLLNELHETFLEDYNKQYDKSKTVAENMADGDKLMETFFYHGVGAYDTQYINLASSKYEFDKQWMQENKGIKIDLLKKFYNNIKRRLQSKLNNHHLINEARRDIFTALNIFCLTREEITKGLDIYEDILDGFTIVPKTGINQSFNDIGDFNEYISQPIIKINENQYYFPIPFSVAEAIYESPYYWMNADKSYSSKALHNRGLAAEQLTYKTLKKVFGANKVFKGVKISQKSKIDSVTDIDVLVIQEKTAVIFQVKSKKLTSVSKKGNLFQIKNDFSKAVEDAFLQGFKCENSIINKENFDFKIDNTLINNKLKNIEHTYTICVVLDVFPAITYATHILLYEKYTQSTIALNLLDLETICSILTKPSVLLDYIAKRIETCRYFIAEEESEYLGLYLKGNLKKVEGFNGGHITGHGRIIDRITFNK